MNKEHTPSDRAGLLADPFCKTHFTGHDHPEAPSRYDAVMNALADSGLEERMRRFEVEPASEQVVTLCHTPAYLALAKRDIARGFSNLSTGDTAVSQSSWDAAMLAAGTAVGGVRAVVSGKVERALCIARPPGHHASTYVGMGFCIFNNAAVAARYAQKKLGIEKVLIVDWDVHHGNGTQDIFYDDDSVFYFSTHQSPWYPGTGGAQESGTGRGLGATLNCPLPAGVGGGDVLGAFYDKLAPAADRFGPDLVIISAGFDSRAGDPLGMFRLTDDDFAELTRLMIELAGRHADGRVVSLLEGGYDLAGLAKAVTAHAGVLAGS